MSDRRGTAPEVGKLRMQMKTMRRRIVKATYLAVLLSLAPATDADAGEYHVYTCRTPSGEPAPADGWSGTAGPTYDSYAKDTCGEGGALVAALGDQTVHLANLTEATWTLAIPAAETMTSATLWRAQDADGGYSDNTTYLSSLSAPGQFNAFDWCIYASGCPTGKGNPAQPLAPANRLAVPAADLGSHIYLQAACEGFEEKAECPAGRGDASGYAAAVYLYAADVVLAQNEGPIAKEVSGPLATESAVQGTSDVTFNATDPGAGIWEVTFSVDGKVVQSTVPDDERGRCKNVGETTDGLAAFLYLQPCPPVESADVGFDTTVVSNGEHHLVVSVLDPAGNSATVLDRNITIENPVRASPAVPASPGPVARHTSTGTARARVTLRIQPRRDGGRGSIHVAGRLEGGRIPKGGKLMVLEGRRRRGRWREFGMIRTGRYGRFRASYPVEFLGRGDWEIRVVCEGAAGYAFATGTSNVVRVRVE